MALLFTYIACARACVLPLAVVSFVVVEVTFSHFFSFFHFLKHVVLLLARRALFGCLFKVQPSSVSRCTSLTQRCPGEGGEAGRGLAALVELVGRRRFGARAEAHAATTAAHLFLLWRRCLTFLFRSVCLSRKWRDLAECPASLAACSDLWY